MAVNRQVLLQPYCPAADDPEIEDYLRLIEGVAGASFVELSLRSESYSETVVFRRGTAAPLTHTLDLGEVSGFAAELNVSADGEPPPILRDIAAFGLKKTMDFRRLRERTGLLDGALGATTSSILLFDGGGQIVYANPAAAELMARQTEGELLVGRKSESPQPLFAAMCSLVDMVIDNPEARSSWSGALVLSDGKHMTGEILKVRIGNDTPRVGVLVQLSIVDSLAERYLGVFALENRLSPREEEVLGLLSAGLPISKVALRLGISPHTVRDHIKSVYRKTGAGSRSELLGMLTHADAG